MAGNEITAEGLIAELFRHNTWANVTLLTACEGLSAEQLDATLRGTFGSVRDTLLHIVGSEVSYVERVTGALPGEPHKEGEMPGIETLKNDVRWAGEELLKLALNAGPEEMVTQLRHGRKRFYKLTGLLTQAINHSTEHRSHVATILTQQGIKPPDMSGWTYMAQTGQLEETSPE
ncbi:MAG: hypothetical protein M3014_06850 [Chloroflexota bacterium]|nr:hypothetical protein [Chloroflexota bacterium]